MPWNVGLVWESGVLCTYTQQTFRPAFMGSSDSWSNLVYSGGEYIVVSEGLGLGHSPDGLTWTFEASAAVRTPIASNGSQYVTCTNSGTTQTIRSSSNHGASWTDRHTAVTFTVDDVFNMNGPVFSLNSNGSGFVLVGRAGVSLVAPNVYHSPDGITWSGVHVGSTPNLSAVRSIGSTYYASGYITNNLLYKSTDQGASWSSLSVPIGPAANVPHLYTINDSLVMSTRSTSDSTPNRLWSTTDEGGSWTEHTVPSGANSILFMGGDGTNVYMKMFDGSGDYHTVSAPSLDGPWTDAGTNNRSTTTFLLASSPSDSNYVSDERSGSSDTSSSSLWQVNLNCPPSCLGGLMGSGSWLSQQNSSAVDTPLSYDTVGEFYYPQDWNDYYGLTWPTAYTGSQSIEVQVSDFGQTYDGDEIIIGCRLAELEAYYGVGLIAYFYRDTSGWNFQVIYRNPFGTTYYYSSPWHSTWSYPETFSVRLESDDSGAFRLYLESDLLRSGTVSLWDVPSRMGVTAFTYSDPELGLMIPRFTDICIIGEGATSEEPPETCAHTSVTIYPTGCGNAGFPATSMTLPNGDGVPPCYDNDVYTIVCNGLPGGAMDDLVTLVEGGGGDNVGFGQANASNTYQLNIGTGAFGTDQIAVYCYIYYQHDTFPAVSIVYSHQLRIEYRQGGVWTTVLDETNLPSGSGSQAAAGLGAGSYTFPHLNIIDGVTWGGSSRACAEDLTTSVTHQG